MQQLKLALWGELKDAAEESDLTNLQQLWLCLDAAPAKIFQKLATRLPDNE